MNPNIKRIILFVLGSAFILLMGTSCNTIRGAGRDIERAGEKIQDNSR